jgi:hypothetical protein
MFAKESPSFKRNYSAKVLEKVWTENQALF